MDELVNSAREVLERHPAPALSAPDLHTLLIRERPTSCPSFEALLQALRQAGEELRILEGDEARFAAVGPRRWVLRPPTSAAGGRRASRSLEARMRESLRTLGSALEPGSNLALARWARLLAEERRARRAIRRQRPRGCS